MPDLWPPNSPDLNPVELCLEYSAGESVRNSNCEHRWTEVQTSWGMGKTASRKSLRQRSGSGVAVLGLVRPLMEDT